MEHSHESWSLFIRRVSLCYSIGAFVLFGTGLAPHSADFAPESSARFSPDLFPAGRLALGAILIGRAAGLRRADLAGLGVTAESRTAPIRFKLVAMVAGGALLTRSRTHEAGSIGHAIHPALNIRLGVAHELE